MEQIIQTVQNLDWSPLYISLKTGIAATIVSFFWVLRRRAVRSKRLRLQRRYWTEFLRFRLCFRRLLPDFCCCCCSAEEGRLGYFYMKAWG